MFVTQNTSSLSHIRGFFLQVRVLVDGYTSPIEHFLLSDPLFSYWQKIISLFTISTFYFFTFLAKESICRVILRYIHKVCFQSQTNKIGKEKEINKIFFHSKISVVETIGPNLDNRIHYHLL